ncbi:MAG TPA: gliding motility-associated C-terminal domain-containing protein, partial [Saprospiraceae bacterium]|nr:gliding motility-associated C-terminal domain-containing protein [Saprospiraceae bacterium]
CAVTSATYLGVTYTQPGAYTIQIDPCTVEQFSIGQDIQSSPPTMLAAVSVCPGECFTFNGQTVCPQAGDTPPSMILTAANGCDSIVTQPFVFQAPDTVQIGQVALLNCAVTSATYLGVTYTQPGAYIIQIDPCTLEQFSIGQDIQSSPPTMLAAVSVCPGECFTFNGQTVCPQAGDAPPSMILTAANGCDSIVTQPFVFQAPDTLQIGTVARFTCVDTTFTLSGITYTQPGDYLKQLDPCTYERFILAKNEDECLNVYVPNVIQAEIEGENSWFTVYTNSGSGIQINYLRIFDRWGNQVFQNVHFLPNDPQLGWNGSLGGKKCQLGVYVFVCELLLPDGSTQLKSGDVTLIR